MITTNDSDKFTYQVTEINGVDIDWDNFILRQMFNDNL